MQSADTGALTRTLLGFASSDPPSAKALGVSVA
jgi:hypothetical protein